MRRNELPEINAGSMADIAFLLLIFFLVTTTMEVDSGILRKIPQKQAIVKPIFIKEKNILEVIINKNNELFVEGEIIELKNLKQIAIDFIDNGGGFDKNGNPCYWCNGKQSATSSAHPSKAFISIKTDRATNYETYISVLDHVNIAYAALRNKFALQQYKHDYKSLEADFKKSNYTDMSLQEKINTVREKYPLLLSDAEIKD
jgi:biopolymer transport protein ExbD